MEDLLFNKTYTEICLHIQTEQSLFCKLRKQCNELEKQLSIQKIQELIIQKEKREQQLFWCSTRLTNYHTQALKLIASCTPNSDLFYMHIASVVKPISITTLPGQLPIVAQIRLENHPMVLNNEPNNEQSNKQRQNEQALLLE